MRGLFLVVVVAILGTLAGFPWVEASFQHCTDSNIGDPLCDVTCSKFGMCYNTSQGVYEFKVLESCVKNKYCTTGGCSSKPETSAKSQCTLPNSGRIDCGTLDGIFPDPYDPQRSLQCTSGSDATLCTQCGDGECYNAKTGKCDIIMEHGQCPDYMEYVCSHPGQSRPVIGKEQIFFVCLLVDDKLYPQMSQCPSGQVFNATYGDCVETDNDFDIAIVTDETCGSDTTSSSSTTTSSSTTSSTTTTTTTTPSDQCTVPGNYEDPSECHYYYYCDGTTLYHMKCLPRHYFDSIQKKCVYGSC